MKHAGSSLQRPPPIHNLIHLSHASFSKTSSLDLSPPVTMEAASFITPELRDALAKVAVFLLVQGLVYLILSKSSNVFSRDKKLRTLSFRPMRSMSVRRVLAPLSDVPVGTDEPSPSPTLSSSWSPRRWANHED